jgi:hypothetical protein
MRRAHLAMLMLALAIAAGPADAQLKNDEEGPEQYPAGPHRDEAFYFCTACHSFKIVAAQGMSRSRWDESLDWMVQRHSMPKLDGEDRDKILEYLSAAFPEKTGAPGGWKNPFAPR